MSHTKTFQYSVKENVRPIGKYNFTFLKTPIQILFSTDHAKGSHGLPGLYFKYDVSALKVIVKQDQESFMNFLIRISSVIAGIIVISGRYNSKFNNLKLWNEKGMKKYVECSLLLSGYLNSFIQLLCDYLIKKLSPETYQQLHNLSENTISAAKPTQQSTSQHQPNNLISNANQMADVDFNFTVK